MYEIKFSNQIGMQDPVLKHIYNEANQKDEKWSKIIVFAMTNVTPIFLVWPNAAFCYFRYFTTDLGNEPFDLLFSMW